MLLMRICKLVWIICKAISIIVNGVYYAGLQQDRMAFRIDFPSLDHMVLRVARPNELSKWVEAFEKVWSITGCVVDWF